MKVKKIAAIALASACAFSMAAVDFNGHRKPVWYASRDFFAPRLATIQPRTSEEYRETHSWEGVKVDADHLELIVLNDTNEPYKAPGRSTASTSTATCSPRSRSTTWNSTPPATRASR